MTKKPQNYYSIHYRDADGVSRYWHGYGEKLDLVVEQINYDEQLLSGHVSDIEVLECVPVHSPQPKELDFKQQYEVANTCLDLMARHDQKMGLQ